MTLQNNGFKILIKTLLAYEFRMNQFLVYSKLQKYRICFEFLYFLIYENRKRTEEQM
jgi:hypothetical protein